jgi:superfamily II DNA/RNA helicase
MRVVGGRYSNVNFEYLGLAPETLRAVEEAGYQQPTPIQAQAIPVVLQGRDVLGIAQTGTGKTASFTLPMIDILSQGRARARMPRSLILEPTRELAAQVAQNFEIYGKYHKLNMALLIGGVSFDDQERKLDRGVDVLIATPGRLLDHFGRGKLMMNGVDILVIDEADRMLDMGFIPDVERICSLITKKHQTLFFSATMPKEIQALVSRFLTDPKRIEVAPPASPAATVEQFLVTLNTSEAGAKRARLRELLRSEEVKNAIVFCNRKRDVDVLYRSLKRHGFNAAALHGDMDQGSRMEVLDKFKGGAIQLLIASDVAARGLDIPSMSHVFNFDVPSHAEDYIHRIGRTGRAGRSGRAFMLSTPADAKWLRNVQSLIGRPINPLPGEKAAGIAPQGDIVGAEDAGDKRGRRRRRRGGDRGPDRPEARASEVSAPEASAPEVSEVSAERQAPHMDGSRRDRDQRRHGRDERRRDDRRRDDRSRDDRRRDDRGRERRAYRDDDFEPVVGLGDHVPEFLLRTFKLAPMPADDDVEDDETLDIETFDDDPVEDEAVAERAGADPADEPAGTEEIAPAKGKRKRRNRGRKKPADAATTAVDSVEDGPMIEAAAEPPAAESLPVEPEPAAEPPAAKPKRARKPRAKAEPEPSAETPAEPKRRSRAAKAAPDAEEPPAPKTRARKRTPATTEAAAETAADAAPEAPRPRRRKAAAKPRSSGKSDAEAA